MKNRKTIELTVPFIMHVVVQRMNGTHILYVSVVGFMRSMFAYTYIGRYTGTYIGKSAHANSHLVCINAASESSFHFILDLFNDTSNCSHCTTLKRFLLGLTQR